MYNVLRGIKKAQIVRWFLSYCYPDYRFLLRRSLRGSVRILDVGCGGAESPLRVVRKESGQWRIGVEGHFQSLNASRLAGIHDEYIFAEIASFVASPPERLNVDCVIALDVIEHFPKHESTTLVAALESLTNRRVILFTPNGFLAQEPCDGNEYQRHLCGWSARELRERGYKVYGCNGPKSLRGEYATPQLSPRLFGALVSLALQPFVFFFPEMAFALFAIKDL